MTGRCSTDGCNRCSTDGCNRFTVTLGLCDTHYRRTLNGGDQTRPILGDWADDAACLGADRALSPLAGALDRLKETER